MAIDRGPWTALVDDDGSNLVGTVWNKDKIKTTLLDPIDSLVGDWRDVPFNAAHFVGITMPAGGVTVNRTQQIGKTLFWNLLANGFTIAGGPTTYSLVIPWGLVSMTLAFHPIFLFPAASGGWGLGRAQANTSGTQVDITRDNYSPFTDTAGGGIQIWIGLEVQ